MRQAVDQANDAPSLKALSCIGTKSANLSDFGVQAARKLVNASASNDNKALLAYVLYDRASNSSWTAALSADGSTEKQSAIAEHHAFEAEAEHIAQGVISESSRSTPNLVALHVLGEIKDDRNDYAGAVTAEAQVASGKPTSCGDDLAQEAYRRAVNGLDKINRSSEAETLFRRYAALYTVEAYEWDKEGDRRDAVKDYATSADSYERASRGSPYFAYDYCYAAVDRYLQGADRDLVLQDGRQCVSAAAKNTDKDSSRHYDNELPLVHRLMGDVLNDRGVYTQALEYLKESLSLKPNNATTLNIEASVYENLKRYSECIAVSQAAIKESDGKYADMHFRLGSCYFDTGDWTRAEDSFRLAATLDKSSPEAAFNAGLCLQRQGFVSDARIWFNEALKRNPSPDLRSQITTILK